MATLIELLRKVHENVHDFQNVKPKKKYAEPKIYTGGLNVSQWNTYSKSEQEKALSKPWYVYYSYRNPKSGKLERQDNIKGGANHYRTKKERLEILNAYRNNLSRLLAQGYNPFTEQKDIEPTMSVKEALNFAVSTKENILSESGLRGVKSRVNAFQNHIEPLGFSNRFITALNKKHLSAYLNLVLKKSSARNRNNTRADLSSIFQVLEDEDIIPVNYIKSIPVLKTKPKRNKTYSNEKVQAIYAHLKERDPLLLLFIKFVSYNFLRPVEVCRLKVGDINLKEKTLTVKAKNKPLKTKIIPEILLVDLNQIDLSYPEHYLFTPNGVGLYDYGDNQRRDYFTKRFNKVVKKAFSLGPDYTIYSFRHTFITKLYREMRKTLTPFETKSRLMLITGHSTMGALEKYLRDIDAELPKDYSDLLQ